MVAADLLVFDMDGVLVDVAESYRETIVQTVKHFSGQTISRDRIQDYKSQGGWNNDWALSQRILEDLGVQVAYGTIVERFNKLFVGENGIDGLVTREQWIAAPGLLERLSQRFQLAIFTGRMQWEAAITLRRFAAHVRFEPLICADDVAMPKPHPEGLLAICRRNPGKRLLYFGDVVDDARSARAAQVPFIGVVESRRPQRDEAVAQLLEEGALAIVEDINHVAQTLACG
jgi:HAD superfamily hydrolase (TIGR01548 family)